MRTLTHCIALLALLASGPVAADPSAIAGTWLSGDGDGLITVTVSNQAVSARIKGSPNTDPDRAKTDVKNPDPALRSRALVGLEIFSGFTYDGEGRWSGGYIYDPNSGKTYRCKLTLVEIDTLKVRGFIGISLLGRTETWTRQTD